MTFRVSTIGLALVAMVVVIVSHSRLLVPFRHVVLWHVARVDLAIVLGTLHHQGCVLVLLGGPVGFGRVGRSSVVAGVVFDYDCCVCPDLSVVCHSCSCSTLHLPSRYCLFATVHFHELLLANYPGSLLPTDQQMSHCFSN